MAVQIPLGIRRRDAVQRIAHVRPDILVPVLVERQRAARVLDEQVQHAHLVLTDLGQLRQDVVRDEVRAARARRERECLLEPGCRHRCCCITRRERGRGGFIVVEEEMEDGREELGQRADEEVGEEGSDEEEVEREEFEREGGGGRKRSRHVIKNILMDEGARVVARRLASRLGAVVGKEDVRSTSTSLASASVGSMDAPCTISTYLDLYHLNICVKNVP